MNEDLRAELLRRATVDARVRERIRAGETPGSGPDGMDVDRHNSAWLAAQIEASGWPKRSEVGDDGARAAWLIAQHADGAVAFQERCCELMRQAVAAGEADPAELALLVDRILVNLGRPQRYGTQVGAVDGGLVALPTSDPDRVDQRRAQVGLGPLEAHLSDIAEVCGEFRPARFPCPRCDTDIAAWLPAPHQTVSTRCRGCGKRFRITGYPPGWGAGSNLPSDRDS